MQCCCGVLLHPGVVQQFQLLCNLATHCPIRYCTLAVLWLRLLYRLWWLPTIYCIGYSRKKLCGGWCACRSWFGCIKYLLQRLLRMCHTHWACGLFLPEVASLSRLLACIQPACISPRGDSSALLEITSGPGKLQLSTRVCAALTKC